MNLPLLAGLAVATVAYRFGHARSRRLLLEEGQRLYHEWLAGDPDGSARSALERDAGRIARAIREAPGIDSGRLTFVDSTDPYPYLAAGEIGLLENFLAPRQVVQRGFAGLLRDALDDYREAERQARSPAQWIQWLLFLPRDLFEYLGTAPARFGLVLTWLQIGYWLAGIAGIALAGLVVWRSVGAG